MKTLFAIAALTLLGATNAFAFDDGTQNIVDRYKANKALSGADVAHLMRASERWCYLEEAGTCSWSDIYLEISDTGATFEIGNAWSETVDIVFTDEGVFEGDKLCESGKDWVPTLRGFDRANGASIMGRDLWAIKDEVAETRADDVIDCFGYTYQSADAEAETVTLMQRQYTNGTYMPDLDALVTLHFSPEDVTALTWRW